MSLQRTLLAVLAFGLLGVPALLMLTLARASLPRENCTLDDQLGGFICSDYGQFYWLSFGILGAACLAALFMILRKRSAN